MNNLKIQNYQPAPSAQRGGRRYRHKKSCKCCTCKKRGGMEPEKNEYKDDTLDLLEKNLNEREMFDENIDSLELGRSDPVEEVVIEGEGEGEGDNEVIDIADDDDYVDLEEGRRQGTSGGTRRRRHRSKSKKLRKSRRTRRNSRKVKKHRRKSHRRHHK